MLTVLAVGWRRALRSAALRDENPQDFPPLSIIIAARNEAPNLIHNLPITLAQSYPEFEVIVVLDRCEDGSAALLQKLQEKWPQLRSIETPELPPGWSGKKWALTLGVRAARYPNLVFTDADCRPAAGWLKSMGRAFGAGGELMLGIGLYERYPGWLNRFIRFETLYAALQYIGAAAWKRAYMGVGRNLAYTRSLFEQHRGYEAFRGRLSGDDDLFVNAYAAGAKTFCLTQPDTCTFSEPEHTFSGWVRQKVRHISASGSYSLTSKTLLALFHGVHGLFYAALLPVLWNGTAFVPYLAVYLIRTGICWYLVGSLAKKYGETDIQIFYPLLDVLFFFYNLSMVPAGLIANPTWRNNRESHATPKKTAFW